MNNKINTFWKLLQTHQVEIPVIQRDYAQGRTDKRVQQIRKGFVEALVKSLKEGEVLPLDFIYGKIEGKGQEDIIRRNEAAVDSMLRAVKSYANELRISINFDINASIASDGTPFTQLIPLDGQQRLTTLYLLHWYLIQRLGHSYRNQLKVLSRFGYQTRKTTKSFCDALTNQENDFKYDFAKAKLSEQLESATWFLRVWLHDPSVSGMLVMLDEIHCQLIDVDDISILWENLTTHDAIIFDFLDLEKLNQTDDLYVKMNARGKPLTDFEHFKAWLQEYVKDGKNDIDELNEVKWTHKIDTKWYDLFWKKKRKETYIIDNTIYDFIKNVGLYEYIISTKKEALDTAFIDRIRNKDNFISVNDFKESNFVSADNLNFIFKSLNTLISIDLEQYTRWLDNIYTITFNKSNDIVYSYLSTETALSSLAQRVFYYGFLLFVNEHSNIEKSEQEIHFKAWMRIIRNLIFNTNIQSLDNFIDALKSLKKLSKEILNIENYVENSFEEIDYFNTEQRKEESKKISYFKLKKFKEEILRLENHSYFYGQIGFVFRLLPNDKEEDFEIFKRYGDRLYHYFGVISKEADFKLQQELLKYGNYFIHSGGRKWSFCKSDAGALRTRNDNWRKVFNAKKDSNQFQTLERFVKEERVETVNDWRKYFIEYPSILQYCTSTFIDYHNPMDIRLLNKSNYNGRHRDLFSMIIEEYCKSLKLKNYKFRTRSVKNYRTDKSIPYFEASKIDVSENEDLLLRIEYHPKSNEPNTFKIIAEEVIDHEILKPFAINDNEFIIPVNDLPEIDNFIENTLPTILNHINP